MSPMRIIILIGALIAAGAAAFLVQNMSKPTVVTQTLTQTETKVEEVEVSKVEVLIADRDLAIGEIIQEGDLRWAYWPEENLAPGFLEKTAAPEAASDMAGSVVRFPIYSSEPLDKRKVVAKGEQGLMAALLTPGMRAVAVEISTESASGGFILPNDRVDLILTHEVEIASQEMSVERPVSTTVLTNVRVLAIDQALRTEEGGGSYVGNVATVEVTPREAELIALSSRMGAISLSLRPYSEMKEGDPRVSRTDMLEVGNPYDTESPNITVYRNGRASVGIGGN